jgi:hypothetical protein
VAPRPPLRRRPRALARRLLGCDPGAVCVCAVWLGGHPPAEAERAATWGRRPLLDGVGELCPWRRGRVSRAAGTQARPVHVPPPSAAEAGARRRRREPKTPLEDQAERSSAPATAVPPCGFSHRGRGNGTACGARETAQALQHGRGEDCLRSASLAALLAGTRALH